MSYTPTTWTTGDTITASSLNKIEQGIANAGGGGSATVHLSGSGYPTQSWRYGAIAYATYDSQNSRWIIAQENDAYWEGIFGFANNIPSIIPLYLTVLPNSDDVGVFFIPDGASIVASVTGDITATDLYFSWGSFIGAYRITGDGSITLVYN